MRMVSVPRSSFIISPSMDAAQSVRPRAAAAVGEQPCISLARCTVSRAVITAIFMKPSPAVARIILSISHSLALI